MNKIMTCDMTFNPVWGCLDHCEYCYARKIAKRFGKQMRVIELPRCRNEELAWNLIGLDDFKPTWLEQQYNKSFPKKPQRIFVGSMSEIYYWKKEWMEKVLDKVRQYPQHTFQFLTKYPQVYIDYNIPKNCWIGATVTTNTDVSYLSVFFNLGVIKGNIYYYSIEPLLEEINTELLEGKNWVILGAETGNRKGKVIPKREWIEDIVLYCKDNNIPVYLKDSLKDIYPVEIKEFPKTEL